MAASQYPGGSVRNLLKMTVTPSSPKRGYAGGHFTAVELVLLGTVLLVAAISLI
jgi:hypothetical protein